MIKFWKTIEPGDLLKIRDVTFANKNIKYAKDVCSIVIEIFPQHLGKSPYSSGKSEVGIGGSVAINDEDSNAKMLLIVDGVQRWCVISKYDIIYHWSKNEKVNDSV